MFGKWSIEILSLLSDGGMMGFQEMRKELGVSSKVLSAKLDQMQEVGIVHRRVMSTKPPRVLYGLEEKGKRVVNLGEPVFLYLRYTEGLRASEVPRLLPKQSREVRPGQR
jgi:DNA-binding HxlR family transcriptional regulator